jgi:hypothetical protein
MWRCAPPVRERRQRLLRPGHHRPDVPILEHRAFPVRSCRHCTREVSGPHANAASSGRCRFASERPVLRSTRSATRNRSQRCRRAGPALCQGSFPGPCMRASPWQSTRCVRSRWTGRAGGLRATRLCCRSAFDVATADVRRALWVSGGRCGTADSRRSKNDRHDNGRSSIQSTYSSRSAKSHAPSILTKASR